MSDKLKISPPPVENAPTVQTETEREAPTPIPSGGGTSVFDQLNMISGGKNAKTESDVTFVKLPANGAGCPRCHASNSRIVFCPYCGSGMCANCTPLIKPMQDGFEYVCPKCSESVFVKKRSLEF